MTMIPFFRFLQRLYLLYIAKILFNRVIYNESVFWELTQQKLTEEISADITNYKAKFIYFLVYDKEKVVKNPQAFRNTYNRVFDGKQVNVILIQPVIL